MNQLEQVTAAADARHEPAALLFVDVDRFKALNDQFGHAGGDVALQEVAGRLRRGVRHGDFLARIAGDEFVVLVGGDDATAGARLVAERVRQTMLAPISLDGMAVQVTVSVGLASQADDVVGADGGSG